MSNYDQTFSPYAAKTGTVMLPEVLTRNVPAALLIEAILINELTTKSLQQHSNVFLIACKSLMQLPSHVCASMAMQISEQEGKEQPGFFIWILLQIKPVPFYSKY